MLSAIFRLITTVKIYFNKKFPKRELKTNADLITYYLWMMIGFSLAYTIISSIYIYSVLVCQALIYLFKLPFKVIQEVFCHPFSAARSFVGFIISLILFMFQMPLNVPYQFFQLKIKVLMWIFLLISYSIYTIIIYFVYY